MKTVLFPTTLAVTLTLILLSSGTAQAATLTKCFKASPKLTAKITVSNTDVTINWDARDKTRASSESGRVEKLQTSAKEISFESYLQGSGDGSSVKVVLYKTKISLQGLWGDGTPTAAPESYDFVSCP